ncbi:MAG TPA: methyltransferase domain-containing protein [Gemmatimonadaceae bacterium]
MATRTRTTSGARRRPARRKLAGAPPASAPPDWWATYFDEQYLREYDPIFALERDRRDVARLVELLELPDGARVLDCPCGQGRHAHLLAEAGFDVDGVDYSEPLLEKARERGTSRRLRYRRADMRRLPARWTGRFDAVLNLYTSFGFFLDARDDRRVIEELARVLKPGGTLIWNGGSRDGVMARFLGRDWWRSDDGTLIAHERTFDPLSGFLTIRSTWEGPAAAGEREHRIRLYTATQIAHLCAAAGLVVEEAYHGWTRRPLHRRSTDMTLVARKE